MSVGELFDVLRAPTVYLEVGQVDIYSVGGMSSVVVQYVDLLAGPLQVPRNLDALCVLQRTGFGGSS
jgi:hypothetical protein